MSNLQRPRGGETMTRRERSLVWAITALVLVVASPDERAAGAGYGTQRRQGTTATQPARPENTSVETRAQLAELGRTVDALQERLEKLESSSIRAYFDVANLKGRNKTISLDPATPKHYQRLDSEEGFFVVSLQDALPYLDGYRTVLRIGNLTSATYVGFKINATWGPRYDFDKYNPESYTKWETEKQTREFSFTDSLRPGAWNRIELIAPATSPNQMGFIEVSITTDTVSLGSRE